MQRSQMQSEEVARYGKALYEAGIRVKVETPENIGKMVIIDVETGEYAIDGIGIEASHRLHANRPGAALYGIRIGYNVAESLGGVMERSHIMMTGSVQNLHALVSITIRGLNHPDVAIEFVVDTGFVGFLTLPRASVQALGLPYQYDTPANLADDSVVQLPVYEATILWEGAERMVRVLAMGRRPLLGMALLAENELVIQCRDSGLVTIEDL